MKALEQRPLIALAHPHIEALAKQTGDTVHLGVLEDGDVFYLGQDRRYARIEMRCRVGRRMPLASTSLGKGLLVGLPRDQWRPYYDRATESAINFADRPPLAAWPEFERRMASYVEQGWSFDLEENEIGIRCVGAPVRDVRDQVVAAVSVASAVPYMPDERMAELGPIVRATAEAISRELGWKQE